MKPRVVKERAVVFTTMDGSFLGVGQKNKKEEEEEEVPWVLWKGVVAWLLDQGQLMPWLLWLVHLIVITQTMFFRWYHNKSPNVFLW